MSDHKNQGGQKQGRIDPKQPKQHQGVRADEPAERSDDDKRHDQQANPDDAARRPDYQQSQGSNNV